MIGPSDSYIAVTLIPFAKIGAKCKFYVILDS
jgi:hypothetical protein